MTFRQFATYPPTFDASAVDSLAAHRRFAAIVRALAAFALASRPPAAPAAPAEMPDVPTRRLNRIRRLLGRLPKPGKSRSHARRQR